MANEVPPFHLRTIPAAIFDSLWVLNPTTNEYEKLSNDGEGITVGWDDVSNKPTVIAAGDDQESARLAIGAGTSNLKIGAAATDAKAGNYAPAWGDVTGKPAVIAAGADAAAARTAIGAGTSNLTIGTSASTAKAGNAVQTATQTTATAVGSGTATNVQAILAELEARIAALEGSG